VRRRRRRMKTQQMQQQRVSTQAWFRAPQATGSSRLAVCRLLRHAVVGICDPTLAGLSVCLLRPSGSKFRVPCLWPAACHG
jgi:hypothetical protein